jgi:esterase/lipase
LKIHNTGADQWLAVSVALLTDAKSTGTNAILSEGLKTLNTGSAGGATLKVTEATVKKGLVTGAPAKWWEDSNYILTPTLELMDNAKAVIAFDANVGLTDTTASTGVTALPALRSAHIPADGF